MKTNMRVGPLTVTTTGSSYSDLCRILSSTTTVVPSVSAAYQALSAIVNYDSIPDSISFDLDQLLLSSVSIKNIITTAQSIVQLKSEELADRRPHVVNITTSAPVRSDIVDMLTSLGVTSILPKISAYGFDACVSANLESIKHHGHIPRYLISHTNPRTNCQKIRYETPINLTARQKDISSMIAQRGLTNRQIAVYFGISESAVKLHIGIVLKKYGVQSRTQLAVTLSKYNLNK